MHFISEKDFIASIRKKYSRNAPELIRTFGEDSAVIKLSGKESLVISCDDFIEGTHFLQNYMTLAEAGKKALLTNISDIIAMGQAPLYYLVSLSLPTSFPKEKTTEIYSGMNSIAHSYNIILIGGNTEVYQGPIAIRITIIGKAHKDYFFFRSNAQPGDRIYISNYVGLSALGLFLLQTGWRKNGTLFTDNHGQTEKRTFIKKAIKEYLAPSIPFDLCMALSRHRIPNAAIDISDGLISDLYEICKESQVGAQIFEDALPAPSSLLHYCARTGIDYYKFMLAGGEDYQLLFTVPEKNCASLTKIISSHNVHCVGKIYKNTRCRIRLYSHGKEKPLPSYTGYDHFV